MKRAGGWVAATFVISLMLCAPACARHATLTPVAATPRLEAAYGRLPLHFEENRGQFRGDARFVARTSTGRIQLAPGGLLLGLEAGPVRLSFAGGASSVVPHSLEALPGRVNYYQGTDPKNWYADIPTFARVRYAEVYPGIDVVVYGNQRQLEYDFVVAPGADPERIRVRVDGADAVESTSSGDVMIRRGDRTIVQRAPVAYQERGDRRERVAVRSIVRDGREVAFEIGAYDRTRPLVIDPVIAYSARIGLGTARGIAVDNAGYAYFTGVNTGAFNNEYPTVNAAYPQRTTGLEEVFVTKLSPDGSTLIYSTYFGGALRDEVHGIATDGAGNAYITGSTHGGVPTTPGAFQPDAQAPEDGGATFVTKFGPTGALIYSTYLQGTTFDNMADPIRGGVCYQGAGHGIAADAAGNAYVVGFTSTNDFPTTPGAYIPTKPTVGERCNVYWGGYLTKLSPDGSSLVYSTYVDGNGAGLSVAVDGAGNAYVGGVSAAPSTPPGTVTANLAGGSSLTHRGMDASAYVAKFNAGGFPTQTTLIGFTPESISVGSDSSIYVAGDSSAARMNPGGTAWVWTTSIAAFIAGIAAAPDGSAWVVGAGGPDTPTKDPLRPATHPTEAVVLQFSATGTLLFGTPLGEGAAVGVDVDTAGNAYVTGSAGFDFVPTTPGAYSGTHAPGQCPSGVQPPCNDVFVVKLSPSGGGGGGGGDTTKPTVSITKPSNGVWTGNSIGVGASASDNVALKDIKLWGNGGVFATIPCTGATCSGSVTWTTGPLPPGAYEVNAVATDTAGNATVSATVTIYKDAKTPVKPSGATATGGGGGTLPPLTATITSPASGATLSGNVTVSMAAGGASGSPVFTLKVDNANVLMSGSTGTSTASTPWSTGGYSNGTHTLNLTVTDGAGRTATSAVTVTVSNPPPDGGGGGGDTTKPTVSITKPSNGVWTGNSIGVGASASDNVALKDIKLWGNGGVFATIPCSGATCSGSVTWTTGPLPPGAYEVNAVATDTAGNQTVSAKITIFKDATSPVKPSGATATGGGGGTLPPLTATITSPASGATLSGNVTVSMAAGGASGSPVFTLKVDNANVLMSGSTGASTASTLWSTQNFSNGTHTLNLTVTDGAGRTATSAVTVTVSNPPPGGGGGADTTPPSVVITSPSNGAWTGNSIGVTASATDNVLLSTLKYYGNGTQFAQVTCGTTTCTSKQWWTTGPLPSGKHTITVVATDTAGNQTTSAPVIINK